MRGKYAGRWQDHEIETLKAGIAEGLTDQELTTRVNRTFFAIQRKRIQLRFLSYAGRPRASDWLVHELEILKASVAEGLSDSAITSRIARSRFAIKGKRLELGLRTKSWSSFSAHDDQILREKTLAGYSAGYIQKLFLPHLTLGSICGRRHRLKLKSGLMHGTSRHLESRTLWTKAARTVARRQPRGSRQVLRVAFPKIETIVPVRIRLMDLESHHCRYPLDDKDDNGLIFYCGNPKHGDHSWCIGHCGVVFHEGPRGQALGHFRIFK